MLAWCLVSVLLLTGVFCYVLFVVNPVITESTRATVLALSTTAVSNAVYEVLAEQEIVYDDIVNVQYGSDGSIELISVDTITINMLVRLMYTRAQENLNKVNDEGIEIALGTFTGLPALVGLGAKINVKLMTVGAISAYFTSNFTSAGINQTNHTIMVNFTTSVSLVLPIYSSTIDTTTEFLICDGVIVGEVPSIYLSENNVIS